MREDRMREIPTFSLVLFLRIQFTVVKIGGDA